MPPLHAGNCACVTIPQHITVHENATDYMRAADDLLRTAPYWSHF